MRFLIVKGIIICVRGSKSDRTDKEIWISDGSPLYTNSKNAAKQLHENPGEKYVVELSKSIAFTLRDHNIVSFYCTIDVGCVKYIHNYF